MSVGWSGHKPYEFADFFEGHFHKRGMEVVHSRTLDFFGDLNYLKRFDLIMPNGTMGEITEEQENNLIEVVRLGVNLVRVHVGAGDAFRSSLNYQWMIGGQFLGHPYVGEYEVRLTQKDHATCSGIPTKFIVNTEQYYMLVDPSIEAETAYIYENQEVEMPVAWVKRWGKGRVFYSSLGHDPIEYKKFPEMRLLLTNAIKFLVE
ncbi:ThuA domain-containing protein [Lentisphaera profundi]|uniref:ThuA domain-containing protein n=1 Tax=Lentisphaera profundi TaxID=1658616 RepID=A0ABY7VTP9_9BACT|nr:ThuA domain-containing protein [Lentisphaera profundi]WDE97442.1 ThuA domain-containing protein [Lentisphaera profundi]